MCQGERKKYKSAHTALTHVIIRDIIDIYNRKEIKKYADDTKTNGQIIKAKRLY